MKVFLDANILYSNTLRGLFIWLHVNRVLHVFWSMEVWEEAFIALERTDPGGATKIRSAMIENAIITYPECMVGLALLSNLGIKDKDDEHVVSAAIEARVDYIVTNDRVLQVEDLSRFDVAAVDPDAMMMTVVEKNKRGVISSVKDQISSLVKTQPKKSAYISSLKKNNLSKFSHWCESMDKAKKLFAEVWPS